MFDRPTDTAAEAGIIKSVLIKPELFELVTSKINASMFDDPNNRLVFSMLQRMHNDGIVIETVALKGYLGDHYNRVGGDVYFNGVESLDALPINIDEYLKTVKNNHTLRVIIDSGLDVAETAIKGRNVQESVSKFLSYADNIANDLSSDSNIITIDDLATDQFARFEQRVANPGFVGIKTGLHDYDQFMGGVAATHLIYIAARPGHGKTSLILTILMNMAKQGIPVLFFSYEMSPEQIFNRLLAIESGVSYQEINTGYLYNGNLGRVEKAFGTVASLPFYMTYSTSMNIDEITNLTTKMVRTKGVKVIGLDYIQLLLGGRDNANSELTYISRMLKLSCLKDNISWLVASQLNRKVEMRDNKRPLLADLRDSGSLEQDGDQVVMLYRDYLYNKTAENENIAEVLIRKNRHGPIGDLMVGFEKSTMKFY